MIAVIFEVEPHEEHKMLYMDIAANLREELEKIEGFLSVERFQSLTNPEKILSLSFFENEEAVARWRNLDMHRSAQVAGRSKAFAGYRLRVASVIRDYGKNQREQAPADSKNFHEV
ncbi:antibiotic biosynthesis monooxygenase family protein [Cohaesibacter gelatinilyticus]|uniref:Heme-degrading monooxygenase HmoA n=1 Tax=Cohaesibacter gelatinilyticus TaxID=372072 RepID=A0A285N9E0_9HYPH|nr:antibiotic biosynthesis monooxygenase [Cohaesibacter gelatinilyticus]SNZ06049.1 Heme-degrading monooxygenase HmoA [Cohaesibacter gelatinilyticus]HAT86054.1 antibiotic biosynthesis monooxygenase [Hyphomicrobiales bacterium]